MKFGESAPRQEKSSEESANENKGKYSLEKWRNAPEETLDPEEHKFIEEYAERMETCLERIREHPSLAKALLREAVRPDVWHTLLNMNKAGAILDKNAESKEGQMALAQEEADAMNEKYDQLREEMEDAIQNFADFIDEANGREESNSGTPVPTQKKNESEHTLH